MIKRKLLRSLTFPVLKCGLLLFSFIAINVARAETEIIKSDIIEINMWGFFDEELDSLKPSIKQELKTSKLEVVILICADCKTDVMAMVPLDDLKSHDWNNFVLNKQGIPLWIRGEDKIPFTNKMDCANLTDLYSQSMYGANEYRAYSLAMKAGASVIVVSQSGNKSHKPGSIVHNEFEHKLYHSMNLSYTTATLVIKEMENLKCIKKTKK